MSVRDRIANLNSSKSPIVTTVGSNEPRISRVVGLSSTASSSESAAERESASVDSSEPKKPTIAERIAKLKAGQQKEASGPSDLPGSANSMFPIASRTESPSVYTESVTKSKTSSRIAMLGANINLASLGPSKSNTNSAASFSPSSSCVTSASNSRESTLEHCQISDNNEHISSHSAVRGANSSGDNSVPATMVHLTLERPSRPGRSSRPKTKPAGASAAAAEEPLPM